MERHKSQCIKLHNELIEIDLNLIELIIKLNEKKLLTRGCCENYFDNNSYIIFEYHLFMELLSQNKHILKFIDEKCSKSKIYYANNNLRHIEYNEVEYNENFKNITEIWIYITFPNVSINDFIICLNGVEILELNN